MFTGPILSESSEGEFDLNICWVLSQWIRGNEIDGTEHFDPLAFKLEITRLLGGATKYERLSAFIERCSSPLYSECSDG